MKYTEKEKNYYKNKRMGGITKYVYQVPVTIVKEYYYIIESKMNNPNEKT